MITPLCILYIEDSSPDILLLEAACKQKGQNVDFLVIDDGKRAIQLIEMMTPFTQCLPEIIIVDFGLPRRNGYHVISAIRNNPALKDIPVVLFTAREKDDEDVKSCCDLGAIYLSKPLVNQKYSEISDIIIGMAVHKHWNRLSTKEFHPALEAK